MRPVLTLCAVLALAALVGCGDRAANSNGHGTSPVAGGQGAATVPFKEPSPAKPEGVQPARPTDPLEADARSLKPIQVQIKPTTVAPAGEKNESAEYEWAILGRVAASEVEIPDHIKVTSPPSAEPGWVVGRVRLRFTFRKDADNHTFDKEGSLVPKSGVRHVQMEVRYVSAGNVPGTFSFNSEQNFDAPTGVTPMTLRLRAWGGAKLEVPGANQETGEPKNLLEVTTAPLDALILPSVKGAETFEGSREIELLRVSGKPVVLKVVR
jgi:hypothetical protein